MTQSHDRIHVSIVIPAYNEERYIGSCLDSIAKQTTKPFEVIVVDNNSTDNTVKIAKSYPFVRVIREPKQGRVFARDAGFNTAKGTIIGRIDADTILPPHWVRYVGSFYQNPNHINTALTGGCYFYNVAIPRIQGWFQGQIAFRWNKVLLGHYILFGSNMAMPLTMWRVVRDSVCDRNDQHEDLDLAIHVDEAGYSIAFHEGLKVGVRMNGAVIPAKQHLSYMMWWPNTLRFHGRWTWIFGWFGAVILWGMTPLQKIVLAAKKPFSVKM